MVLVVIRGNRGSLNVELEPKSLVKSQGRYHGCRPTWQPNVSSGKARTWQDIPHLNMAPRNESKSAGLKALTYSFQQLFSLEVLSMLAAVIRAISIKVKGLWTVREASFDLHAKLQNMQICDIPP